MEDLCSLASALIIHAEIILEYAFILLEASVLDSPINHVLVLLGTNILHI